MKKLILSMVVISALAVSYSANAVEIGDGATIDGNKTISDCAVNFRIEQIPGSINSKCIVDMRISKDRVAIFHYYTIVRDCQTFFRKQGVCGIPGGIN